MKAAVQTPPIVALVGNPNAGKTALFNRLTGSRHKVANYPGVTVERRSGVSQLPDGQRVEIIDLPGLYSLSPRTQDERIAYEVITGGRPGELLPDVLVCVVDATNLRLHLRFALEVLQLGRPTIIALNLFDRVRREGIEIDVEGLQQALGVPVVPTVAVQREGVQALRHALAQALTSRGAAVSPGAVVPNGLAGTDVHERTRALLAAYVRQPEVRQWDVWLDRWLLHPVFGLLTLAVVSFLIFQAVYAWAAPVSDAIDAAAAAAANWVGEHLPAGPLTSLLAEGVIPGVGSVLVFLPQILVLFFFILVLDESGYLPRAAFLLDRLLASAGLSGRSFIPLLSSFACAIPGIMATRTISDPRDRLATIIVAPLMTCSARLPVYTLLVGALVPARSVGPGIGLQGLVMTGLYALGIASALLVASFMRWWRSDRAEHALLLELPAYRLPRMRDVLIGLADRAWIFLRRVGGIILALTVLLWVLLSWPAPPAGVNPAQAVEYSLGGRLGHALYTVFAPLGFNWQISLALIPGLAAREVIVSALGTVYALESPPDGDVSDLLLSVVQQQWSMATGLALLVWFVYAPQCVATWAVIRRETGSWRVTVAAVVGLFALAYVASWCTYRVATWLGV
ncbi:ferrous iron transporter B [Tepidimonas sp.]|uniref:ferrous iron transporter B n=1 Tax=Tepidimonas sp. TaxID=2002775 RepID=UPI002FE380E4